MLNTFRVSISAVALAAICFASPFGIFQKDTSVTQEQFSGHVDFNSTTGEYSLTGAGGEIAGKTDGFHYLWKRVTGDVTVNADARFSGTGSNSHSQLALMVRQSLDPDAAYAAAMVYGDGRSSMQYRVDKGASTRNADLPWDASLGQIVHLSIRRRGDAFICSIGRVTKMGGPIPVSSPITVVLTGPVYVGLAVASPEDPKQPATAVFSNLLLQGPGE